MNYLWTLCLYGLFVDCMFVWTPILCCGLFVNCVLNISVLWILYEFSVIFCIFSIFFALKLIIFGGLPWPPKIANTIFGTCLFLAADKGPPKIKCYFRRLTGGHRKQAIFGGWPMAAENMALFSASFFWRPGTIENKPKAAENSLFSAVSGRRKCL
jgi:hypothetical protein